MPTNHLSCIKTDMVINPALSSLGSFRANQKHLNYRIDQSKSSIKKPGLVCAGLLASVQTLLFPSPRMKIGSIGTSSNTIDNKATIFNL